MNKNIRNPFPLRTKVIARWTDKQGKKMEFSGRVVGFGDYTWVSDTFFVKNEFGQEMAFASEDLSRI